jgi:hypothetical protein
MLNIEVSSKKSSNLYYNSKSPKLNQLTICKYYFTWIGWLFLCEYKNLYFLFFRYDHRILSKWGRPRTNRHLQPSKDGHTQMFHDLRQKLYNLHRMLM